MVFMIFLGLIIAHHTTGFSQVSFFIARSQTHPLEFSACSGAIPNERECGAAAWNWQSQWLDGNIGGLLCGT